ncbi:MAG: putative 2OG-Fe(II) oxygenase [Gammaproteobacteria bacterium]
MSRTMTDSGYTDSALRKKGLDLLRDRKPAEAAEAFTAALVQCPSSAALNNDLGRALNNQGDLKGAESAFRKAVELDPGFADALANLGHVLSGLQRTAEAEAAFQQALGFNHDHLRALQGLGILHLANQQPLQAAGYFEKATETQPDDPRVWGQLGAARQRAGDCGAAEDAYKRALSLNPGDAETRLNHGITLQELDRLDDALAEYQAAARLAPGSLAIQNHLGNAFLAAGRAEEALSTTDVCLQTDPGNTAALSLRGVALARLGRADDARRLVDTERLIRQVEVATPADFEDVRSFNTALAGHVLADETLTFEPDGHATRKGGHTRDLLRGDKGPVAILEQFVMEAARTYLETLDVPSDHPFPGRVPRIPRLAMWAVVMEADGHQLPHIHPAAWLSGVYYVSLPSTMGGGNGRHEGWIEFGLPPDELQSNENPEQTVFEPHEGQMFLFPSYFYHRTIPFSGDERRICIAFDVLRRRGSA